MGSQEFLDPRKMGPSQQDAELRCGFISSLAWLHWKPRLRFNQHVCLYFVRKLLTYIYRLSRQFMSTKPLISTQLVWYKTPLQMTEGWTIVNCAKVIGIFGLALGKHQQQQRFPTLSPCHPLGDLLKDAMSLEMDDSLEELRWDHLEIQCCLSGARVYWKYWPTSDSMGV